MVAEVFKDKRGRQPEVPFGYESLLTDAQRHAIDSSRNFGWSLHFIRRPLFQDPTVVMCDANHGKCWQVLEDGKLIPFNDLRGSQKPL
ncbi:conserved hypothetical protein [Luminiphilus syltensis NOR5-1B]|uniref:Uncharacterized protein n=1 Tax=Luminiphilus syltensis NOR5-1B TaxID=565045 RepID=B8KXS4_9GAMM|nr:hypothetical protein [Luminiphilus syltensis]EED34192.1 conserved hypothetical protein [Luminiphilus syltensis NOR5-1B]